MNAVEIKKLVGMKELNKKAISKIKHEFDIDEARFVHLLKKLDLNQFKVQQNDKIELTTGDPVVDVDLTGYLRDIRTKIESFFLKQFDFDFPHEENLDTCEYYFYSYIEAENIPGINRASSEIEKLERLIANEVHFFLLRNCGFDLSDTEHLNDAFVDIVRKKSELILLQGKLIREELFFEEWMHTISKINNDPDIERFWDHSELTTNIEFTVPTFAYSQHSRDSHVQRSAAYFTFQNYSKLIHSKPEYSDLRYKPYGYEISEALIYHLISRIREIESVLLGESRQNLVSKTVFENTKITPWGGNHIQLEKFVDYLLKEGRLGKSDTHLFIKAMTSRLIGAKCPWIDAYKQPAYIKLLLTALSTKSLFYDNQIPKWIEDNLYDKQTGNPFDKDSIGKISISSAGYSSKLSELEDVIDELIKESEI